MKILFYAPLKPLSHPDPSGDREIARGLHQFFLDQGHEVEVLSEFRTPRFYQKLGGWLGFLKSLPEALEKAIRFKPDVIFTYHMYYKAPDPLGPICALALRKPYFIFEGMYSIRPRTQLEYLPGYLMSAGALKTVSHVFTDKTDDITGLKKILKDDQVTYMQPSIDLEYFTRDSESRKKLRSDWKIDFSPVITCIAMLRADRKADGVKFLIECLSELKNEGMDFQAHFVGGGPCEKEISELIQKELGESAVFHGSRGRHEVLSILNASDIFAFPGIDEGFGLVYTEAQAMGLPVVAFDNGGIPDAVDKNESGFVTPLMNIEEY
ncbi:MAG: glycosyltransferase family 4 protein, partial [Pseudobdellovibrionaceae bacterium]